MDEKDLSEVSLADLKELATGGDSEAQYELGYRYFEGDDTRRDYEKAATWVEKAAKQGHVDAQVTFADMFWDGDGVQEDWKQAWLWYNKAAEQGNAKAAHEIAIILLGGYADRRQDIKKGLEWLQTAANRGNLLAQRALDRLSYMDNDSYKSKRDREAVILLLAQERWEDPEDGGVIYLERGVQPTKKDANKFLLGCILDFQMNPTTLWNRTEKFAEEILGDPKELWKLIDNFTKREWLKEWMKYPIHRFKNKGAEKVRRVAKEMVLSYGGDARKLWRGLTQNEALARVQDLAGGVQIPRMIVGILKDNEQITGTGDVKVDTNVKRVLGRILRGYEYTTSEQDVVVSETRKVLPRDPWLLDQPLFRLGREVCFKDKPDCQDCYLRFHCTLSRKNGLNH